MCRKVIRGRVFGSLLAESMPRRCGVDDLASPELAGRIETPHLLACVIIGPKYETGHPDRYAAQGGGSLGERID